MSKAELKDQYRQVVHEARMARDLVTDLLVQFKNAERKAEVEESKFAEINREIIALDQSYEAELLPLDEETVQYGQSRLALLKQRDKQAQAMQTARGFREELRMQALRADQTYIRLEHQRQNVLNAISGELGQVEGGVFRVA